MAKNRTILTLGYDIPSNDSFVYQYWDYFGQCISLSDYDIVVIKPSLGLATTPIESLKYWKNEFSSFLKRGGLIFVMLCSEEVKQGVDGFTTYDISNYSMFPFSGMEFINATGSIVQPKGNIVNNLYSTFKDAMEYRVYINKASCPTFLSRDGKRILGAIQNCGNGYVVYTPYIDFDACYDDNFVPDEDEYTEQELKVGHKFINCLNGIYDSLISNESSVPDWLNKDIYFTQEYTDIKTNILLVEQQIGELTSRKQALEDSLISEQVLSALLYETGKSLEHAVSKALYILGYTKAESFCDGKLELDQVIVSPEGDRFIGECEGKDNGAINVDKFRQLNDSIYEDFQRDEIEEKAYGIIFGNPQRLTKPEDRVLTFTEKCINNAKREGVGLIKTIDLFKVAKYVSDTGDEEYARSCREAIKEQLGQIVVFPEIANKVED